MRTPRFLVAVVALATALPLAAQVAPEAGEVAVSTSPNSRLHQRQPAVALARDQALLAWDDEVRGVMARRFAATMAPRGGAFVVAANDPLPPLPFRGVVLREGHEPALATRPDGSFVVAWVDQKVNRTADIFFDTKWVISSQVVAQFFDADGAPMSRVWPISAADRVASSPRVVFTGSTYLVTWQEGGRSAPLVYLRRLERRGPANPALVSRRGYRPAIAVGGDAVMVTWERCCGAHDGHEIFGRLFDHSGKGTSDPFAIADDLPVGASLPAVGGQKDGSFLAVYQRPLPQDARSTVVYGQLISHRGALVGGELVLSAGYGDAQSAPEVGTLSDGGWLVGWMTWVKGFRVATTGLALDELGNAVSNPFDFNQGVIVGLELALATNPDGRILAAWEGFGEQGDYGVRARAARGPSR